MNTLKQFAILIAAVITIENDPVRNGYCYSCVVNYYKVIPANDCFVALTKDAEAMKRYSYFEISSKMKVNQEEADWKDRRDNWIVACITAGLAIIAAVRSV